MKTNKAVEFSAKTHEGGRANAQQSPLLELERAVSTCLLWENAFYEKGSDIADRISSLCLQVTPEDISTLAIKARTDLKLRHVPLWLCVQLLKRRAGSVAGRTIEAVVQRPDEMGELISLYRKEKRVPLAAQLKRALAKVFTQFNAYQLGKWNKDAAIKLRDVMFLVHPKPKDSEQAAVWKQLVDGTLESPDTWEVALSAGKDKKDTWERLLREKKLGYMALLMNLRNMSEASVETALVEQALRDGAQNSKALPFRFVSAHKHAPQYAQALSEAMEMAVTGNLPGSTAILIDVSGSMGAPISEKSTLQRYEAAAALAVLVRGISKNCRIFVYNDQCQEVSNLKGLGLLNAIKKHVKGATYTEEAVRRVNSSCNELDRMILITDEQAHDGLCRSVAKHAYLINVAPYKPELDLSGSWVRINGFSERVIDWIKLREGEATNESTGLHAE